MPVLESPRPVAVMVRVPKADREQKASAAAAAATKFFQGKRKSEPETPTVSTCSGSFDTGSQPELDHRVGTEAAVTPLAKRGWGSGEMSSSSDVPLGQPSPATPVPAPTQPPPTPSDDVLDEFLHGLLESVTGLPTGATNEEIDSIVNGRLTKLKKEIKMEPPPQADAAQLGRLTEREIALRAATTISAWSGR